MKNKLKVLIPVIIVLIIFLVGLFIGVKNTYNIELKNDKFIYEYGEEIVSDVSVYLKDADSTKNINNYILTSKSLNINDGVFIKEDSEIVPVGSYEVTIKYKKKSENFIIEVLDTVVPEFTSSEEIIEIEESTHDVDLTSYFGAKDLAGVSLRIEGEYDLSKPGEYNLKTVAEDENKNTSSKDFTLKVTEKPKEVVKTESSKNNNQKNNTNKNVTNKQSSSNVTKTETSTAYSGYRKDISDSYVNQVNAYRKSKGLSELPVTSEAQAEADRRAKELVSYYSHDGVGYAFGEVIGNGGAGGDFISAWKNSPPHNATLLREGSIAIAASVYEVNGYWYTVISFKMNY